MIAHRLLRAGLLITVILTSAASRAADWPQWRGPQRQGISTERRLLQEWPAGGPRLAWKTTGLGIGHSSVVIVGDLIFTQGDTDEGSFVFAFSRKDGKPAWKAKVGKAGAPGWGGFAGPRSTPTVDGDRVYALGQYGELVCVNAKDGTEEWRRDYVSDFEGPLPEWGFSESILVDGHNVICTPGGMKGTLLALDKTTGAEVWRSGDFTDPAHYSSPIATEIDGVRQIIQLTERSLVGVAASDGKLLWRAPRKGATAVIPTPIYNDNHVYVTSAYGTGCNLFKVTKDTGGFSAVEVYANKVMVNHHGGVILLGDHVYGYSDSKGWTCQEFKTGNFVWQEKGMLGKGSLVFANGRFYCRQEDRNGTIALLEATPGGYREHGRFDQPDRTDKNAWAHPVVAGGRLYIRDQDVLFCYNIRRR